MITLTERAKEEVERLLHERKEPGYFLRVGVKGGGCSGFSYVVNLDKDLKEHDKVFNLGDNTRVVCDQKSFIYLDEIQIDFSTDLVGGGFRFSNPNASGSCGCGTSFSV